MRFLTAIALLALAPSLFADSEVPTAPPAPGEAKPLDKDSKKNLIALIQKLYAKDGDQPGQDAVLEELARHHALLPKDAQEIAKLCLQLGRALGPTIPKGNPFDFKIHTGEVAQEYIGASPSQGKGLWIGLHGGGVGQGSGDEARGAGQTGLRSLFPSVTPNTGWYQGDGQLHVMALLLAAIRTYDIDTDRVYLSGHSMGGFGAWNVCSVHADRFAGMISGAGGGEGPGAPANMYNTPVWFYHSTDDPRVQQGSAQGIAKELAWRQKAHPGGYDYVYKQYGDPEDDGDKVFPKAGPGVQHGFPPDGHSPPISWILKHPARNPYPTKLVWCGDRHYKFKRQFAWLYSPISWYYREIVAEWKDKSTLEIVLKSRPQEEGEEPEEYSGGGLPILLNPKLVDFAKPLVIRVNGQEVHNAVPTCSAWAIAASIYQRLDAKQFFVGHVTIPGDPPDEPREQDAD